MVAYLLFRFFYNFFTDLEDLVKGWFIALFVIAVVSLDIIICWLWPENDDE
jgi:hypothetical protein